MTLPVTSLADIVVLAFQQYGIRFQLTKQQLVDFANHIQYIAYNKDLKAFEEWGQVFVLGQDIVFETDTYVAPIESDIGKRVDRSGNIGIGTLLNFETQNRRNRWIVAPLDGGTNISLDNGETLTISGGSAAFGRICDDQDFLVSSGPYRVPTAAAGNPPFRKLIGITTVTDKQQFGVPPNNGFNGFDDYGLLLNTRPGRFEFFPYRANVVTNEIQVTLITSTPPEIEQTTDNCTSGGGTLNTSKLRWAYYMNPPPIQDITDESSFVLPERYRYEIMLKGISRLADTATYGDMGDVEDRIRPLCERFWEDMGVQFQAFGRNSDYISDGDSWDWYGLGQSGNNRGRFGDRGQSWF